MKLIRIVILALSLITYEFFACTTAIVSGKGTPDGRPLLLKHRDTSFDQNKLMFFHAPTSTINFHSLFDFLDHLFQKQNNCSKMLEDNFRIDEYRLVNRCSPYFF